ncbi:MAG: hypothetical protein KDD51_16000 [Bdellovibrionales bacterium]|nr:hypothetical protein [Bdellovibrionales bacterium]MCB0419191.1 hypothetical protein [Bdellovibrionales bacterium]
MRNLSLVVGLLLLGITPALNLNVGEWSFSSVPQAEAGCRSRCHVRRHGHGGGHARVSVRVRYGHGFYRPFPVLRAVGRGIGRAARFVGRVAVGAYRVATWPFYAHHRFHRGFAYGCGSCGQGFGHANVNVRTRIYF